MLKPVLSGILLSASLGAFAEMTPRTLLSHLESSVIPEVSSGQYIFVKEAVPNSDGRMIADRLCTVTLSDSSQVVVDYCDVRASNEVAAVALKDHNGTYRIYQETTSFGEARFNLSFDYVSGGRCGMQYLNASCTSQVPADLAAQFISEANELSALLSGSDADERQAFKNRFHAVKVQLSGIAHSQ